MPLHRPKRHESSFEPFDDLSKYEKGIVARAFLEGLISQGYLASPPSNGLQGNLVISLNQWQLEFLTHFSKEGKPAEEEDKNFLENLDQIC